MSSPRERTTHQDIEKLDSLAQIVGNLDYLTDALADLSRKAENSKEALRLQALKNSWDNCIDEFNRAKKALEAQLDPNQKTLYPQLINLRKQELAARAAELYERALKIQEEFRNDPLLQKVENQGVRKPVSIFVANSYDLHMEEFDTFMKKNYPEERSQKVSETAPHIEKKARERLNKNDIDQTKEQLIKHITKVESTFPNLGSKCEALLNKLNSPQNDLKDICREMTKFLKENEAYAITRSDLFGPLKQQYEQLIFATVNASLNKIGLTEKSSLMKKIDRLLSAEDHKSPEEKCRKLYELAQEGQNSFTRSVKRFFGDARENEKAALFKFITDNLKPEVQPGLQKRI